MVIFDIDLDLLLGRDYSLARQWFANEVIRFKDCILKYLYGNEFSQSLKVITFFYVMRGLKLCERTLHDIYYKRLTALIHSEMYFYNTDAVPRKPNEMLENEFLENRFYTDDEAAKYTTEPSEVMLKSRLYTFFFISLTDMEVTGIKAFYKLKVYKEWSLEISRDLFH